MPIKQATYKKYMHYLVKASRNLLAEVSYKHNKAKHIAHKKRGLYLAALSPCWRR